MKMCYNKGRKYVDQTKGKGDKMVEYDKIKYTELKKVVMSLNDKGVLRSSIRHVAVKGPQLYDDFMAAIENLSEEDQLKLPDDVIDFFNYALGDVDDVEPAPEPVAELEPEETPEPNVEPEPEETPEPNVEPEPEETPEPVAEPAPNVEPVAEPAPEEEPAPVENEPKPKIKRLSKSVMTAKVEDSVLTITFSALGKSKAFKLPEKDNLVAFRIVRTKALDFAEMECDASKGQLAAVTKTLNIAGYRLR